MPKPYYEDASGIVIYNADCRLVLPHLPKVDLVLTDPPYPGMKGGTSITFDRGVAARSESFTVGTPWGGDITPLVVAVERATFGALVFCSFHFVDTLPALIDLPKVGLVSWYKRNSMPSACNSPHFLTEYVWAFKKAPGLKWRALKTHYDIPMLQAGCMADERICNGGFAAHPTQKPLALVMALLRIGGESVLDPYCGTGTTLVAAKQLGRHAIGIEIEERYCAIAVERLRQEMLPLSEPAPQPTQDGFALEDIDRENNHVPLHSDAWCAALGKRDVTAADKPL